MKSVCTRFLILFGILAVLSSIVVFYQTYEASRKHAYELISQQAALALEFNLAIRDYAANKIRPVMEKFVDRDVFIPETMSTSYISRHIFEEVEEKFPDYIIRFSSDNPRNPINRANPDEQRVIEYFRKNPQAQRLTEEIQIDGKSYLAHFSPRFMKPSCMQCHSDPKVAPAELVKRYGPTASFHRQVGDVAGLDTVAVPVQAIKASLASEMRSRSIILATVLALLFGSIFYIFKFVVARRLVVMAKHFDEIAAHTESPWMTPVEVTGHDEISGVGVAFNKLVEQLRVSHASLEQRVEDRTAELRQAYEQLHLELIERERAEEALRASLRFLEIAPHQEDIDALLSAFMSEIKDYTGCEAIGIRVLDAAGGIPYQAYCGFSQQFYEMESPLSLKTDQCMCNNVIKGTCDPRLPFYTPGGSFYMNGTSRFLATVAETDKGRTRNMCNQEGYESVALIPFRHGDRILGLIHVADRQENLVPLDKVEILEKAAMQLGTAFIRLQTEEALRNSEQFLTDVFNGIQDGLSIIDPEFNLMRVNPAIQKFGYTGALVGRKCYEAYHGRSSACEVCPVQQTLLTGEANREIITEQLADGCSRYLEVHTFPLKNHTPNHVKAVIANVRDITETKRAEDALRRSEARLTEAQRIARLGNWEWDIRQDELFWTDEVYRIFGLAPQELHPTNDTFLSFIHPDDLMTVKRRIEESLKTGKYGPYEYRIVRRDGSIRWLHGQGETSYQEGQPLGLVGTVQDITESKQAQEDGLRFNKLESLAILAGGIAHDFNNILTAIMGNISLSMLDIQIKGQSRERLAGAERACQQAQNLSQQLLTFSKGGAPIKKIVSVREIALESASFACRGSQVNYQASLPDDLWAVEADPGQISQVCHNLVINAIQAMPSGGIIRISGENRVVEAGSEMVMDAGRYVKISIQDEGIGIAAEHLSKIFDPYFTTKQRGSGLGLATSYAIIKNHRGHIAVESKLGKGTTFEVYLPASDRKVPEQPQDDEKLIAGKGKVLVMDDDTMVREVLGKMLQTMGYEVKLADDGTKALELYTRAQDTGDPFATVILDLTVPGGMGGKEVMSRLLQIDPQVKAIVSSGYSDDPIMANYQTHGFTEVIAKPYTIAELDKVLKKASKRR